MKGFLITCTLLMCAAGFYGAVDMSDDIRSNRLIEYEHVRERHAKHLLAIIKATHLPMNRNKSMKKQDDFVQFKARVDSSVARRKPEMTEIPYMEIFSRGEIELADEMQIRENQ
jgi:hypothetical protein